MRFVLLCLLKSYGEKAKLDSTHPLFNGFKEIGLKEWFLDTTHSKDFVECPLIENAVEIQNTLKHIIQSQKDTFNLGEQLWCKINPYLWHKSLNHAVSF